MALSIPNIGRYQITGELGKGAMGVVYKALDPNIGRPVAIKTMRLDVHGTETEDMLRRFKNEARAAGVLNHTNIVAIYDAGEHEGSFYIAMEHVDGTTLHHLLAERHMLPPEQVIEIACQVCEGLDYAHSHGVIHRDVKPANIMIGSGSAVKIMDFGIAKAGADLTNTGQVVGTPNYMSPEQVKGRPLDGRTDLFSLGVILYEALTGEKPFTGQNVTTIIYKIVNENPIPPRELDVTIHPGLSAVITKSLEKAPDARYQTGAELARDLQNYKSFGSQGQPMVAAMVAAAEKTLAMPAHTVIAPSAPPALSSAAASSSAAAAAAPARAVARAEVQGTAEVKPLAAKAVPMAKRPVSNAMVIAVVLLELLVLGWGYYRNQAKLHTPEQQARLQVHRPQSGAQGNATASIPNESASAKAASSSEKRVAQPALIKEILGELRLTSSPSGAQVKIDGSGAANWITPTTVSNLKPGLHTITFSKNGFIPETRRGEVMAGKRITATAELAPRKTMLVISSDPPGAALLIDEKETGKVTPAQVALTRGEHKVVLHKEGFQPNRTMLQIYDGDMITLSRKLRPQGEAETGKFGNLKRIFGGGRGGDKGTIEVRTRPQGAQIIVNNVAAPQVSPFRFPMKAGTYQITLKLDGYKPVQRTIMVEKGKVAEMDQTLERR